VIDTTHHIGYNPHKVVANLQDGLNNRFCRACCLTRSIRELLQAAGPTKAIIFLAGNYE